MARWYEFVFSTPTGYETVRGQGNTKRTAERRARWRLMDRGFDPKECDRVGRIEPIPAHLHPVNEYSLTDEQIREVRAAAAPPNHLGHKRSTMWTRTLVRDCDGALEGAQGPRSLIAREWNKLHGWED